MGIPADAGTCRAGDHPAPRTNPYLMPPVPGACNMMVAPTIRMAPGTIPAGPVVPSGRGAVTAGAPAM